MALFKKKKMAFKNPVCHILTGEMACPISPSFLLAKSLEVSLTRVSSQVEEILAGNSKKSPSLPQSCHALTQGLGLANQAREWEILKNCFQEIRDFCSPKISTFFGGSASLNYWDPVYLEKDHPA